MDGSLQTILAAPPVPGDAGLCLVFMICNALEFGMPLLEENNSNLFCQRGQHCIHWTDYKRGI